MKYELVVIWDDGEKEVFSYPTEAEAKEAEDGYHKAFGNQLSWTGIRRMIL